MTSGEPGRSYLQLKPDELVVTTATDLHKLLNLIKTRAGLSYGQIAAKTGVSRSQVFSLMSAKRSTFPRKREQIEQLVTACWLSPAHVDLVIELWVKVKAQHKDNDSADSDA
jgi:hypothetical protein